VPARSQTSSVTTSYTVRALSKLAGKPVRVVEDIWRQAREFTKSAGNKGRYDLVLKASLDMLGITSSIDPNGSVEMFGIFGTITKSTSSSLSIETKDGQVSVPLILLVFNKL